MYCHVVEFCMYCSVLLLVLYYIVLHTLGRGRSFEGQLLHPIPWELQEPKGGILGYVEHI